MRIEQLHYLLELYRTRSFSKAAENVFITQPSLSTSISNLEDELGVKLFERTRSGIYPTPMGEAVVKLATKMVEYEDKIYRTVRQSHPQDRMRLLTIPALSFGILLPALGKFQQTYQHVNLTLQEYPPSILVSEAISRLNEEPGTFALCALFPKTRQAMLERLETEHIEATHLLDDQFVCHLPHNHPLAQHDVICKNDFLKEPGIDLNLLTRKPPSDVFTRLQSLGTSKDYIEIKGNTNIEVDTLANLKKLVLNGNGLALMPSLIVYKDADFERGALTIRNFSDANIPIEYHLLKSNLYPLKPMEEHFLNELTSYFSALTPLYQHFPPHTLSIDNPPHFGDQE